MSPYPSLLSGDWYERKVKIVLLFYLICPHSATRGGELALAVRFDSLYPGRYIYRGVLRMNKDTVLFIELVTGTMQCFKVIPAALEFYQVDIALPGYPAPLVFYFFDGSGL